MAATPTTPPTPTIVVTSAPSAASAASSVASAVGKSPIPADKRTLWPSGVAPVVINTTSPPRSPLIPSRNLAVPAAAAAGAATNNVTMTNVPSGIASSLASASASASSSSLDGQIWAWTPRTFIGATPSPRAGHSLTTVNQGTALVVYGGQGRASLSHDTIYLVDGVSLESACLSAVEKAERRIGHTALDLYNHLYVFGGWNAKKYLDHGCLLDIEHEHLLIEQDATPARRLPPARRDHSLTRIGRQMYLFGGWNCADQFNDIWILDRSRGQWLWQETTATGPQPNARRGHTATRVGTRIYIWGGLYGYTKFLADLWVLDTATMEWSQPKMEGVAPSPRAWHTAVPVGNTGKIIYFGGTAGRSKFSNEIFLLDTTVSKWQKVTISGTPPSPRCSHAAAMIGSVMIVHGGLTVIGADNRVHPTGDVFSIDTHIENIWEEEAEPSLPSDEQPKSEQQQRPTSNSTSKSAGGTAAAASSSSSSSNQQSGGGGGAAQTPMMVAINAVTQMNANKTTITTQTGATIKTVKKATGIRDVFGDLETKSSRGSISGGPPTPTPPTPKRALLPSKSGESKEEKGKNDNLIPLTANGNDELIEEIEGWLAMQVGPDEQWYTRYFRLLGTDLIAYEEKEKGSLLLQDGVIKRWVNKREQKSHKMEKLMEAVATQRLDKDTYDDLLRAIVSMPDATPMKELVAFMTASCNEENILFYAGVDSFRKILDPAAALSAATELWNKYVRPGAEFELGSLSTMVRQGVKQQIDKPDIQSTMFDRAQKQIGWTMAVDILPKFLAQLKTKMSLLVPADEQFTLKSALVEEDKTVPQCENCMVRFNVTTRRNYCRYCGLIYCNPCVSKLCTLPPQYGVGTTRVRVCDMCSNIIMTQPNHVPFSYISRKRGRPLNLAAETDEEANAWITAIEQALRTPEAEPPAAGGTVVPLHREGWLMKEDPTSKMYRRRYFILHHNTLWYYEMKVKRALSLVDATLEAENTTAPTVRPLTKAQGGFAAGLNYAHRFKITCIEAAPATPLPVSARTLSGTNAAASTPGTMNVLYNLSAPSDEDRVFWRNEIHRAIRTQPRIKANLQRGQTAAELASVRTGGGRRAAPTGAATGGTATAAALAQATSANNTAAVVAGTSAAGTAATAGKHDRQRSMSETDKARGSGGISSLTPTLTTLAEHGTTPPSGTTPPTGTPPTSTPATPSSSSSTGGGGPVMSNAAMRAILESGAAAAAAALQRALASPSPATTAPSPLLSIQTSSPHGERVMQIPAAQSSLRSVYVFALLANSRKMAGQDQILCRTALFMNESLIRFNGFEIRVPPGGVSPTATTTSSSATAPVTRPHSMSLANMGPTTAASVAQQYFNAGIALQFSTVAAAIHWCVKVQGRVATLQWKPAGSAATTHSTDSKEEKKTPAVMTATGTADLDGGPRLCLGIHVHTRSLSMDGLNDGEIPGGEDDDDDDGKGVASLASPTSGGSNKETKTPVGGAVDTSGSSSPGGRMSRGLRMAHRLARTAVAGQTLCSRDVWRLWGQTIENREIRRSRVEARESGDVAHTVRGDVKEDDDEDDEDDVDDRSDDEGASSATTTPGMLTPSHSTGTMPASGSLQSSSSSSSLVSSSSGVLVGTPGSSAAAAPSTVTPKARRAAKKAHKAAAGDEHETHERDDLTALVGEEDEDYGIHLTELDAITIGGINEPVVLYEVGSITAA